MTDYQRRHLLDAFAGVLRSRLGIEHPFGGTIGGAPRGAVDTLHVAVRKTQEVAEGARSFVREVVDTETFLFAGVDDGHGVCRELTFHLPVVVGKTPVQRKEIIEVQPRELRQVFRGLLFQYLLGQLHQLALHVVALAILHAVLDIGAEHLGQFLHALVTRLREQLVDARDHQVLVLEHHVEVEGEVELVGESTRQPKHKTVDCADGKVGVVVEYGRLQP